MECPHSPNVNKQYSLCNNELETLQCLISTMLVPQADAFNEHCKTDVIVEVLPMLLTVFMKFCKFSECCMDVL